MADELTAPLDLWRVWLESGHTIEVAAHDASETEGWITFKALVKGTPPRASAEREKRKSFSGGAGVRRPDAISRAQRVLMQPGDRWGAGWMQFPALNAG